MMEDVATRLTRGVPMSSKIVEFRGGEGDAAKPLGEIQKAYPSVVIGSYPFQAPDGFATNLVLRSRDEAALDQALAAVKAMADELVAAGKEAMDAHRHQYAVTWGSPELRGALGAKLTRFLGTPVDAERELVSAVLREHGWIPQIRHLHRASEGAQRR